MKFYKRKAAAAAAKSLLSCPTLCDPIDGSPPGSPVPGILQARTLEWVAISFSNVWKWEVKVKSLSCVRLFAIPWTAAYQAPPSMGFSRQDYWSGVPLPSPKRKVTRGKKDSSLAFFLKWARFIMAWCILMRTMGMKKKGVRDGKPEETMLSGKEILEWIAVKFLIRVGKEIPEHIRCWHLAQ